MLSMITLVSGTKSGWVRINISDFSDSRSGGCSKTVINNYHFEYKNKTRLFQFVWIWNRVTVNRRIALGFRR